MRRRSAAAVAASMAFSLATLVGADPGSGAPAAPTQTVPSPGTYPIVLSGDFTGDGQGDLFFHSPSLAVDVLYDFNPPNGPDERPLDIHQYWVQGNYRPVVGQFGNDDWTDDILWYQPGGGPDVIWDFTFCGSPCARPSYRRLPVTINGDYTPVSGRFYPGGVDDVLWYGRGSLPDSIWDFQPTCATCAAKYSVRPITINGTGYQPIAGHFTRRPGSTMDIFWYNPHGPEHLWQFSTPFDSQYRSISPPGLQVKGTSYKLAVADLFGDYYDDIIFFGPGAVQDSVWDFYDGSVYSLPTPEPLTAAYTSITGVEIRDPMTDPAEDFFVYDANAARGRYYDIFETDEGFAYLRYDFDPAPLTALPPAAEPTLGAAAAATEGRRWIDAKASKG